MPASLDERLGYDEALVVWQWRFEQAVELGVPAPLAIAFADSAGADLGRLRGLIARGAEPELAARIVL